MYDLVRVACDSHNLVVSDYLAKLNVRLIAT